MAEKRVGEQTPYRDDNVRYDDGHVPRLELVSVAEHGETKGDDADIEDTAKHIPSSWRSETRGVIPELCVL